MVTIVGCGNDKVDNNNTKDDTNNSQMDENSEETEDTNQSNNRIQQILAFAPN